MRQLHNYIRPYFDSYIQLVAEGFRDLNAFLDKKLESETGANFAIALVISTPFIGAFLFFIAVQLSV